MKAFDYFEPKTIAEATQLLSEYNGGAKVLAGGVDLLPRMRKVWWYNSLRRSNATI